MAVQPESKGRDLNMIVATGTRKYRNLFGSQASNAARMFYLKWLILVDFTLATLFGTSMVLAMILCLSVCLSVCLSQTVIVSKRLSESRSYLAYSLPSIYPTLYLKEIWVSSEIRVLPSGTFPKPRRRKFLNDRRQVLSTDDRRRSCGLSH